MGATVENGAETPVQDQDLEAAALDAQRSEEGPTYEERLDMERAARARGEKDDGLGGVPDPVPVGEKVPQTHKLKFTNAVGDGAPPDLKRGEYVYFEGVAKVMRADVVDKLDGESFITLEAIRTVTATVTDLRFERGHVGPELDPDQQALGL